MTKSMTPHQHYVKACAMAKEANQSLRTYCAERGVNHSTVCKWKDKRDGTIFMSILDKLNGPPKRKAKKEPGTSSRIKADGEPKAG